MSNFKRYLSLIGLVLTLLLPTAVAAQVQRMAIASGTHVLRPNATQAVNSYCLDYTRHAPSAGTKYSHVLSSSDSATVSIGNRRLPLSDAIAQGIVAIEGQNLTVSRLLDLASDPMAQRRLSPEAQAKIGELRSIWNRLPDSEKQLIERSLAARPEGDHTQLKLVNKTSAPVSINISNGVVVGTESEPLPTINIAALMSAGRTSQGQVQSRLWREATQKHQLLLKDAGYFKGSLTGEVDQATQNAITRFKHDRGLGNEPIIDSRTETALLDAAQENRESRYLALLLERTPEASTLYRLSANGKQLYVGDKIAELTSAINSERDKKGRGNNVYLILKGFTDEKADTLLSSCRTYQKSIDSMVSIRPFQSSLDSTNAEEFFFSPGKAFLGDSVTAATLVVGGRNDGYYGSSFIVQDKENHSGTITAFSKVKQVVIDFVEGARTMFQIRQADWSPAKIANVARSRLRRKFELSEDGIRIEFKDEIGRTHIGDTLSLKVISLAEDFE